MSIPGSSPGALGAVGTMSTNRAGMLHSTSGVTQLHRWCTSRLNGDSRWGGDDGALGQQIKISPVLIKMK